MKKLQLRHIFKAKLRIINFMNVMIKMDEQADQEIEQLKKIMKEISLKYPDIIATAVLSPHGLPIVTASSEEISARIISAMAGALLSVSERAVDELRVGKFKHIILDGEHGKLIILHATKNYIVALLTGEEKTRDYFKRNNPFSHDNFDKPLKI